MQHAKIWKIITPKEFHLWTIFSRFTGDHWYSSCGSFGGEIWPFRESESWTFLSFFSSFLFLGLYYYYYYYFFSLLIREEVKVFSWRKRIFLALYTLGVGKNPRSSVLCWQRGFRKVVLCYCCCCQCCAVCWGMLRFWGVTGEQRVMTQELRYQMPMNA